MSVAGLRERSAFQLRRTRTVAEYGLLSLRGGALRAVDRLSRGRLPANRRNEMSQSLALEHLLRSRDRIIGMTSFGERAYCQWYAQRLHTGEGVIAELGCWLGSATIPLATGLSRNPRREASSGPIHVFDLFRWDPGMEQFVRGTRLEGRFAPGEGFLDAYLEELGPYRPLVEVHQGDLAETAWTGAPIEFLVVDAMKSWPLANTIVSEFYPALIPGKGLLFHQDFAHWRTPWIHLLQYRLRDSFELAYDIPRSDCSVFRLVRPLPREVLGATYDPGSFDDGEIDAAFEHSIRLSRGEKHANIRAAKVRLLTDMGQEPRARAELDACRSEGLSFDSDLRLAAELLDARGRPAATTRAER